MDKMDALEKILAAMHSIYSMDADAQTALEWVFGKQDSPESFSAVAAAAGIDVMFFHRGVLSRSELARRYVREN